MRRELKNDEKKRCRELLAGAKGKRTSDFSFEESKAIVTAMMSNSKELRDNAIMLVSDALENFMSYTLFQNGVTKNSRDFDDYMQSLRLVVIEELENWTPESGQLTTFFRQRFEKAFMKEKNKSSTITSLYYENVAINVSKAKKEMMEETEAPSAEEIYKHLQTAAATKHTLASIKTAMAMQKEVVSLYSQPEDGNGYLLDTIAAVEADDETIKDMIEDHIRKLKGDDRKIISAIYSIYQDGETRKNISNDMLRREVQKYFGEDISDKWLETKKESAKRALRRELATWACDNGYKRSKPLYEKVAVS